MFEKFTSIILRICTYAVEIYNIFLLYKILPSFWTILFSFIGHSFLMKLLLNIFSKNVYSKLLDKVVQEFLSNGKLDITETKILVEKFRPHILVSLTVIMLILYIIQSCYFK